MLVDRFDYRSQNEQELCVLGRCFAGVEQIYACIGRQRPVIMLTRAVDALKRLFVKQALEIMLSCGTLHYLHSELVMVGGDIYGIIDRSKLMLGRCSFVMLGLGIDTQPPQLLVDILHISCDSCFYRSEIVVVKLLSFGCRCAVERSSCKYQVFSVGIHFSVDKEILLLGTCIGDNSCSVRAEQLHYTQCGFIDSIAGAQQRCFFIQSLAAVGAECCWDTKCACFDERIRGRVPCGIASCFKGTSEPSRWEAGSVRLAFDKLLARKFHYDMSVICRGDKAVVLFGSDACHWLEPMCEVGTALFDCPVLHCVCNDICKLDIKRHAVLDSFFQLLIGVFWEPFPHDRVIENIRAENCGHICHKHSFLSLNDHIFTF